ncbi:hypothetical protein SAMN05216575_1115 [Ectopseudomonas alcaliphila]|uniref:Uncharacterized protein n=1 Tax=Ectopseudomonas alcaliphila TaxID=101564 RepID=A0A1G7NSS0_9GAMM|nr:hypothetical protein SAMN05216575_1115 [Pseudomonas alcaliphila]
MVELAAHYEIAVLLVTHDLDEASYLGERGKRTDLFIDPRHWCPKINLSPYPYLSYPVYFYYFFVSIGFLRGGRLSM